MKITDHSRPDFSTSDAEKLGEQLFGIRGSVQELPGERDRNFHLKAESGQEYVLKIANATEQVQVLQCQSEAMAHIARRASGVRCPKVYPSKSGELISHVKSNGVGHFVRLLSFLRGRPLAMVNPHSPRLLRDVGSFLGHLSFALRDFSHPGAERDLHWDLKNAAVVIRDYQGLIVDAERREIAEFFLDLFETRVMPEMPSLRTQVLHNDANDYNIIVEEAASETHKIGLIDFGDMVTSCTVFELAIGCAYAVLHKPDPVSTAAQVIGACHSVCPLTEPEIELLYPLICARLTMSVCISSHQQAKEPENKYLSISEQPAWDSLGRLKAISPSFAHYTFRHTCKLIPNPKSQVLVNWLAENRDRIGPVVPIDLSTAPSIVFDLSVGSLDLSRPDELADMRRLSRQLFDRMAAAHADVGVGRYNEARLCYQGEQFRDSADRQAERRTIHIGMDLFMEVGTPILAPLAGRIHSFQNNALPFDYGPTLILEHEIEDRPRKFFTLYGHLAEDSLKNIGEGAAIEQGDEIGRMGDISANGGWPPHLHFQLITDMLEQKGDFPGVAFPSERAIWLSLSPDPNLILRIPSDRFPKPETSKKEISEIRARRLGKSLSLSYEQPLKVVRGYKQFLYDENGQVYLDAVNNVAHVGHSHPKVVAALHRQAVVLNTNTRYLHDNLVDYASRLCATMPEPLTACFFVNSGSEANELALRLARTFTGQTDTIVVDGAYHGNSGALIDISSYKFDGPGGTGAPSHGHKVVMPDTYRGPYKISDPDAGNKYADHIDDAIEKIKKLGRGVAAFICESLLGCGGQIVLPDGYLEQAFQKIRAAGGVCFVDEVQVGFGRVGSQFWGFHTQGVVPDIVTLGKPIGNGHPLGAVVTTAAIAESFNNGMEYFNTFGGNPVSCAVGLAVLDVIEEESLQENALTVGRHLKAALVGLKKKHALIGDVRGLGLFLGVELVVSRDTLAPAVEQASYIAERMKDHRILISTDGPLRNVLKIKPPLVFTKDDADFLVQTLDGILMEGFCIV